MSQQLLREPRRRGKTQPNPGSEQNTRNGTASFCFISFHTIHPSSPWQEPGIGTETGTGLITPKVKQSHPDCDPMAKSRIRPRLLDYCCGARLGFQRRDGLSSVVRFLLVQRSWPVDSDRTSESRAYSIESAFLLHSVLLLYAKRVPSGKAGGGGARRRWRQAPIPPSGGGLNT